MIPFIKPGSRGICEVLAYGVKRNAWASLETHYVLRHTASQLKTLRFPLIHRKRVPSPCGEGLGRGSFGLIILLLAALLLTACRAPLPDDATPSRAPTVTLTPRIGVNLATRVAPTAVIIQTTPTPLPTPTVTPTATPIVYQIAAGDTLLAIAIARQTTVKRDFGT
jgi:hypothetical protein